MDRKDKRAMNWLRKKAGYGKYIIDCRNHPCIVVRTNFWFYRSYDIDVKSLITGSPSSCSLWHCGIEPITKEQAEEMVEFAKNNKWFDYLVKYCGYRPEDEEEFNKMQAKWNFETNK